MNEPAEPAALTSYSVAEDGVALIREYIAGMK
jgi:hypothetical protein